MNAISAFPGFPQAALDFLANLAANNNREWFEAHKDTYQTQLLEPAQAFVVALGSRLQNLASDIDYDTSTNGRGVLMRIHRDTRFSQDKAPYKRNISGMFRAGSHKKMESPGFGFQLEPDGMGLITGIFKFSPEMLTVYRNAVVNEHLGPEIAEVVATLRAAGGYSLGGEAYKRVPAGYDAAHANAQLLRHDGLYVFSPRLPVSDILSPVLVDRCYEHFQKMAPLYHWLQKLYF